jgi:hypothetical protein
MKWKKLAMSSAMAAAAFFVTATAGLAAGAGAGAGSGDAYDTAPTVKLPAPSRAHKKSDRAKPKPRHHRRHHPPIKRTK